MKRNFKENILNFYSVTFVSQTSTQLSETTVSESVKEVTDPFTPGPVVTISGPSTCEFKSLDIDDSIEISFH